MVNAVARFSGFAADYDAARPHPPAEIADLLQQWSGARTPDVVDVGAGTGLSALIWAGRARTVTAIEPGDDMRAIAARRLLGAPQAARHPTAVPDPGSHPTAAQTPGSHPTAVPDPESHPTVVRERGSQPAAVAQAMSQSAAAPEPVAATRFTVAAGNAEATGLPDACADIVTASQAMHWFDAARALPEIARVLRPGGVFAAYDCDWPPCIDWETDCAYAEFARRMTELEAARGLGPPRAGKEQHLGRMRDSGLFRHAVEVAVHSREQGDAARLASVALSQGGAVALLEAGLTEDELGLTALREVAGRRLPVPRTWWWTYRVRMAVR